MIICIDAGMVVGKDTERERKVFYIKDANYEVYTAARRIIY